MWDTLSIAYIARLRWIVIADVLRHEFRYRHSVPAAS